MKRLLLAAATVAGLAVALPAAAQFQKPEDAIKYRQSALTVMATHFGRLGAMVQGRVPFDAATAASNAEIATVMSKLPFVAFMDGTSMSQASNTKAKPEIWTERAKFDAAATKMQDEMAKLNVAAKSGSLDQIKAAFGPVGVACKACHDDYRAK
jgi:cytochrome c556